MHKKIALGSVVAGALLVGSLALADSAWVTLNTFSGPPAATLTVSGGGMTSGDNVAIYFGSTSGTPATSTVVVNGQFSAQATVPANAPSGPLAVYAVDTTTHDQASNSYYVVPLAPSVSFTAALTVPFATTQVSGSGFAPGEQVLITLGSSSTTTTADQSGAFSNVQLTIPNTSSGLYLLHATGQSSDATAINYFWINPFYASASPSSWYVQPGGTLSFNGSGFAPGEQVTITTGGQTVATTTADATGAFTNAGSFTVPLSLRNSTATVNLHGAQSNSNVALGITVGNLYPYAYPNSWYLLPGGSVSFQGGGFGPGEMVHVYQNSDPTPVSSFTAGSDGTFMNAGTTTVPFHHGPSITYTLVGAQSDVSTYTAISVGSFYPTISPSSYYSAPGGTITVTGSGFAPNENVLILAGTFSSTTVADGSGNISMSGVQLPSLGGISIIVSAHGAQSGAVATVGVTLGSYYPVLSPSTYYAFPGDTIMLSGSAFAPNETLTITGTAATATTTATGTFSTVPVTIPLSAQGAVTFTATGNISGTPASATITIGSRYFGLSADSYYVSPGGSTVLRGNGFLAGETVTASATGITSVSTTTNPDGTFALPVTLPHSGTSATITVTSSLSGASVPITITLAQLNPWFELSSYWAQGGSPLTITGGGFADNEQVIFSSTGGGFASTTADQSGNINLATIVPFVQPGTVTITGTGAQSGVSAHQQMTVAPVYTNLQLGSYAGAPGTAINFIGSGYLPNEPIAVMTDRTGSTTVATFNADANGSFNNSSWTLPDNFTEGNLTITVTGLHSFDSKSIVYYVTGH